MKELKDIAAAWHVRRGRGESAVLATVVRMEGSAYRKPGARMLVCQDGETFGGVSGGCLEADVVERARRILATGQSEFVMYDSTRDDDLLLGTGLGCQGVVSLLIERLTPNQPDALTLAEASLHTRQRAVLATVCTCPPDSGVHVGERLLLWEDARADGCLALRAAAEQVLMAGQSRYVRVPLEQSGADVFCELMTPPLSLVIFGAGPDAGPLVQIAQTLGWHVTVTDHRPAFATPARVPQADVVLLAPREGLPPALPLDMQTAVVVMTHNYLQDRALLAALLPSPARYLGLLGPRQRTERMLQELQESGLTITPAMRARLYGPIGLDIGAQTPEQIALAVAAEIQAVFAERLGGFLCLKSE